MSSVLALPLSAINVNIDFSFDSSGFFSKGNPDGEVAGAQAKAALEAAADFFSFHLADDLDAITPGGSNTWTADFADPSGPGRREIVDLNVSADSVVIFAGGQSLSGSTLGEGGTGGFSIAEGSSAWFDGLFRRGETGTTQFSSAPTRPWQSAAPDEVAPWGGAITFDSDGQADGVGAYSWSYDHTVAPVSGQADFFSVALHEIAHALGFGTSDSWRTHVIGEEFDRQFDGMASTAANGGVNPDLQTDSDPPSHWINGIESNVFMGSTLQEAAMNPSLTLGNRGEFTELDMAGFTDIGWDVVPEPSSLALLGLGLAFGLRRRR